MNGVLNEHTETIHRRENGRTEFHTACGATNNLDPDQLREIPVERAAAEHDASRCGRCFDDGGGY